MRSQCCSCCDEGERIFTYLLNHFKLKHYEDYHKLTPETIIQICNCPEALRLKLQFVNHILMQKISKDKNGDQQSIMSCDVTVKTEEDSDEEIVKQSPPSQLKGFSIPETSFNGSENNDTKIILQHLRKLEADLLNEMQQMQTSLTAQITSNAIDLECMGFPMSRVYHIQTMSDYLRENQKYKETFSYALTLYVRTISRNFKDREICSRVYGKLFTDDLRMMSNTTGRCKSDRKTFKIDEIVFDVVADVLAKTFNRDDKSEFLKIFHRISNRYYSDQCHSMKKKEMLQARKLEAQQQQQQPGPASKKIKTPQENFDFSDFGMNQWMNYGMNEGGESNEGSSSSFIQLEDLPGN